MAMATIRPTISFHSQFRKTRRRLNRTSADQTKFSPTGKRAEKNVIKWSFFSEHSSEKLYVHVDGIEINFHDDANEFPYRMKVQSTRKNPRVTINASINPPGTIFLSLGVEPHINRWLLNFRNCAMRNFWDKRVLKSWLRTSFLTSYLT